MSCFLSSISDPFIFNMCSKDRSSDNYSCQRHSYGDLRELRQARFLLQVCRRREPEGGPSLQVRCAPGASEAPSEVRGTSLWPPSCLCTAQCPMGHPWILLAYVWLIPWLEWSSVLCCTLSPVPAIWLLGPSLSDSVI